MQRHWPGRTAPALVVAALVAIPTGAAQQPPVFPATGEVVRLDLVVHDRAGKVVEDLREDEVQVFEDGVSCPIRSFRRVRAEQDAVADQVLPNRTAAGLEPPVETGLRSTGEPASNTTLSRIVLLVFGLLGPEGTRTARAAARSFVGQAFPPRTWFGVFKVGDGLRLLQAFTEDRSLLPAAIDRAATGADQPRDPATTPDSRNSTEEALEALLGAGAGGGRGPDFAGAVANMLWLIDSASRQQKGRDALYPLLALAKSLEGVAGRKTLLYFSEGLDVPPELEDVLRATVSQANRSNLSVYALDARGLTTDSPYEEARLALAAGGSGSAQAQAPAPADGSRRAVGKQEILAPEIGAAAIRMNVQGNLQDLSESTGGFLIANTNDLRPGLARVGSDLSHFYEVAYVPPNPMADGRFRSIQVKVLRPGLTVRTRRGYYALPPGAAVVLPYELALAQALEAPTPPRAFDLRAATLDFAGAADERETVLLVEVPLSGLRFTRDEATHTYRAWMSLLGLVKDERNRLVARLSHDWPLEGRLEEAEATQRRTTVVKRVLRLAPGRYTLETAAQDRESGAISAQRTRFDVPAAVEGLALGSVAVGRAEEVPADRAATSTPSDDPLRLGSLRFVPGLGKPVMEGTPAVSLLVTAHPGPGAEPVKLTLEFRRDGKTVAQAQPELPPADARGRIAYVGSFPTEQFAPGRYVVWARASQGTQEVSAATSFTIAPQAPIGVAKDEAPAPKGARPPDAAPASAPAAGSRVVTTATLDPKDQRTTLETILERAGAYVTRYAETFRYVVAEEQYRQWFVDGDTIHSLTLRSDLVFVSLPGPLPWTAFRDVYEVDGRKLRDRDRRLEKLFMQSSLRSAAEQADAVLQESSRYNLGPSYRTINVPTLGLLFLLPENQKRLAFEAKESTRAIAGFVGAEIAFKEASTPTLVHDRWNNDVPARGRFWIDPMRGTVLRSEIQYDLGRERRRAGGHPEIAFLDTEYRRETGLSMFVPAEMSELYDLRAGRIEARARYSNFRRFEVTTEEKLSKADALPPETEAAPPLPPPELPMLAAPPLPNDVRALLEKASDYVARYELQFRNVAAIELCRQLRAGSMAETVEGRSRSDAVFAMVPGAVPWTVFRESSREDRKPGEPSRLERLFRDRPGSAVREASALQQEAVPRGSDTAPRPRTEPTLALATLRPDNRDGYHFERRGIRAIDGVETVAIEFVEVAGRTLVQDALGRNLPARGTLWVRETDGAVLRSEVSFRAEAPSGEVLEAVTEYRPDPDLGILVPAILRERLSAGALSSTGPSFPVETTARYEQFRRISEQGR